MENINIKAEKYAEGKAYEAITKAIAEAYAEGFKDGYKTREEEVPVDLRDNKTEYMDLGLPSGTLWAADYEKEDGKIAYKSYAISKNYNLPTTEQWEELQKYCKWEFKYISIGQELRYNRYYNKYVIKNAFCIGPNGNILHFIPTGNIHTSGLVDSYEIYFWLMNDNETIDKKAVKIYTDKDDTTDTHIRVHELFTGYKLPIRLVK